MLTLILTAIFALAFIAMGVFIHCGKGWWLIAGYNMSSESEKSKYDEKALCKFIGKISIAIGLFTLPIGIERISSWYWIVYTTVVMLLGIFAVVYANTGNRFKKSEGVEGNIEKVAE